MVFYEDNEMKNKFKKKYILAEGYPWGMGILKQYKEIAMSKSPDGFMPVIFEFPVELWDAALPKYRLVLERIDE
jgi:hypothetical protein